MKKVEGKKRAKKKIAIWQPFNLSNLDMFLTTYFAMCVVNDELPFL